MNNPAPPTTPASSGNWGWLKAFVIFFAVVGLITMLGKCSDLTRLASRYNQPQTSASFVKTDTSTKDGKPKDYFYELGGTEQFKGSPFTLTRLYRKSQGFKGYQTLTFNYLLLNTSTGKSVWLWQGKFPYSVQEYKVGRESRNYGLIEDLLIAFTETDSDKSGYFDEKDLKTLAILRPDPSKPIIKLLENIQKIENIMPLQDNRMLIIYVQEGKTFSAIYSRNSGTLSLQQQIPEIALP